MYFPLLSTQCLFSIVSYSRTLQTQGLPVFSLGLPRMSISPGAKLLFVLSAHDLPYESFWLWTFSILRIPVGFEHHIRRSSCMLTSLAGRSLGTTKRLFHIRSMYTHPYTRSSLVRQCPRACDSVGQKMYSGEIYIATVVFPFSCSFVNS